MPRKSPRSLRASLAARGAAAIVLLASAVIATIAASAGAFRSDPTVTADLPSSAGPVRAETPVQFRGVRVGRLSRVEAAATGARLTLRLDPARIHDIPAGAQVRLLPRTLFGDQYLDLAVPAGHPSSGTLAAGAHLPTDTSKPTMQLYQAYTRMYQMLDALQPAKLQVALTGMADSLRGRGGQLGGMIDEASDLAHQSRPMLDTLGPDLHAMSRLSADLKDSAPDLVRSLDNAVALSAVVVDKRRNLEDLFSAGIDLTDRSNRVLAENSRRTVQLVRSSAPIADVLGHHPTAFSTTKNGLDLFLDGANRAFATGFFKIRAKATLENSTPYGPADCPRYPGLAGPNCGAGRSQGGPIGPVGSPEELNTMQRIAPLLPPGPPPAAPPSPDMLGLLLGPMVRGSDVVTP